MTNVCAQIAWTCHLSIWTGTISPPQTRISVVHAISVSFWLVTDVPVIPISAMLLMLFEYGKETTVGVQGD